MLASVSAFCALFRHALFALGQPLTLEPSFTRRDLLTAMRGAVLARGRLDGTYER